MHGAESGTIPLKQKVLEWATSPVLASWTSSPESGPGSEYLARTTGSTAFGKGTVPAQDLPQPVSNEQPCNHVQYPMPPGRTLWSEVGRFEVSEFLARLSEREVQATGRTFSSPNDPLVDSFIQHKVVVDVDSLLLRSVNGVHEWDRNLHRRRRSGKGERIIFSPQLFHDSLVEV